MPINLDDAISEQISLIPEIGPNHPLTYRQELAPFLFASLQAQESSVVVGAASMGKSRLLQFLLRLDVRRHYLGDASDTTLLIWADCNRMAAISEWGFYELLLTTLVEAAGEHPTIVDLRNRLNELRREVILEHNELLAQRHLELAVRMVCQERGLNLCILVDEFDESYRELPIQALANLRALRDANKYRLIYVLFMRDHPSQLRPSEECEGFYELVSRSVLGLQPYGEKDAHRIITQLQTRRGHELPTFTEDMIHQILYLSGGHPGLITALVDALTENLPLGMSWEAWAQQQPGVQEELRKLWIGLCHKERKTLNYLAQGLSTNVRERESLLLKGLIRETGLRIFTFFTPLWQNFAATQALITDSVLRVDFQSGAVYTDGVQRESLTAKEFELVTFLYEHAGEICDIDQIITKLYPGDEAFEINNNSIAALVGRVRKKIEANPQRPQYLLNVKGRGYRLVTTPK